MEKTISCCSGNGHSKELIYWIRNVPDGEPMPENHYCDCTMGLMRAYFDMNLYEINEKYNGFKSWYDHVVGLAKIESDYYLGLK